MLLHCYLKFKFKTEDVTLHSSSIPFHSSIPSHSYVSILVFFVFFFSSKRSEEVLLIFFVFLEISKMRNRIEINLKSYVTGFVVFS